jgi:glutamyl-tRNA synthetase
MKKVRTRFAPSPTGFLHIGGIRTAFFSWALAKRFQGDFILRIEDTDRKRLVPGSVQKIIEDLNWFGITPDEGPSREDLKATGDFWEGAPQGGGNYGPYIQSLRGARYHEVAEQLVDKGFAYRCDCTAEMLEKERLEQMARKEMPGYSGFCRNRKVSSATEHVIRLKIPFKRTVTLHDAVKGRITWDPIQLKDPVILKSDKLPLYHLAVVVDDHDMEISHVIRGDDWISTTPIHLLLYEYLGWEVPVFAHCPNILGNDGKKLSKRHGSTSIDSFREEGYLSEALFNFSMFIGWSPGEGVQEEKMTRDEIVSRFSLEGINTSGGVFDYTKLNWLNGVYIRELTPEKFIEAIQPYFNEYSFESIRQKITSLIPLIQERVKNFKEVPELVRFLIPGDVERDTAQILGQKGMTRELALRITEKVKDILLGDNSNNEYTWKPQELEKRALSVLEMLNSEKNDAQIKKGPFLITLRIAVLGKANTPPLFESFESLGKEEVIYRLEKFKSSL